MRLGSVFRQCTRCKHRVAARDRRCPKCGYERFGWAYVVDLGAPGSRRDQRKRSGFMTKAEAISDMQASQAAKAAGSYVEPTKLTVGRYLEDWIAAGSGGVRESTLRGYRVCVERHIVPRIGAVPLQAVTRLQIQAMYGDLSRSGNTRWTGGLSAKSVHNVQICLHTALEEAVRNRLLAHNPSDGSHKKPRDRPEMRCWTLGELRVFLTAAAGSHDSALYRMAAQTGMRRGELLGLRWRDLDLERGVASVRQQWSRQGGTLRLGPPKTRNALRSIDLDIGTVEMLRNHRAVHEFERRSWGEEYRTDLDLVFGGVHGGPQDPDVVYRRFARLVRRLSQQSGIQTIRMHDLRHTHATLLLEDGLDAKYVSERLGHDSVQTTLELYGHVTSRRRRDAAKRIGAMVDGLAATEICDPAVTPDGPGAQRAGF